MLVSRVILTPLSSRWTPVQMVAELNRVLDKDEQYMSKKGYRLVGQSVPYETTAAGGSGLYLGMSCEYSDADPMGETVLSPRERYPNRPEVDPFENLK